MAADWKTDFDTIKWLVTLAVIWWGFGEPVWHSKFRYSIQYDVPYSSVTKLKEPHKCDFFTAPIGSKNCHYDPEVTSVRTALSTEGKAIVSFDGGQNWVSNDASPPLKPSLLITWKKIDEDEE